MTELLLGCGHARQKLFGSPGEPLEWKDLVTLDINEKCDPDIICDLDFSEWFPTSRTDKGNRSLKQRALHEFKDEFFHEIHAYEVLEHLGQQGFVETFFSTFRNIHRLLVPNGILFATVPSRHSTWVWSDPSHRRVITQESLCFLDQSVIKANRERGTQMSDFSDLWNLNFKVIASGDDHIRHSFALQAIK